MPWHVERSRHCPDSMPWAVIKDADGSTEACHATEQSANRHMAALYANEPGMRDAHGVHSDHYRSFTPDLQVRSGGDGRTIYGILVPYRTPVRIHDDLVEQWAPGAFNHQLREPHRVKFEREHVPLGGKLIGAATVLRNDAAGLYGELRASKTPDGDETIELVRDGALDELSIHFLERQNRKLPGGIVERLTAHLKAVAVVMSGAYGRLATVAGVRSAGVGTAISPATAALRAQAEQYLSGLPDLSDHDLEIRALNLGLRPIST